MNLAGSQERARLCGKLRQLFALAYNLDDFLRRLALSRSVQRSSSTTLREKLIKIGAKVVTHSRYVIFQMAEMTVPRELFARILERIQWFWCANTVGATLLTAALKREVGDSRAGKVIPATFTSLRQRFR